VLAPVERLLAPKPNEIASIILGQKPTREVEYSLCTLAVPKLRSAELNRSCELQMLSEALHVQAKVLSPFEFKDILSNSDAASVVGNAQHLSEIAPMERGLCTSNLAHQISKLITDWVKLKEADDTKSDCKTLTCPIVLHPTATTDSSSWLEICEVPEHEVPQLPPTCLSDRSLWKEVVTVDLENTADCEVMPHDRVFLY
jgi:hypothetical protein